MPNSSRQAWNIELHVMIASFFKSNNSVGLELKDSGLEGIIPPCHLYVCYVVLRISLWTMQKVKKNMKLSCAVSQVREKLEKFHGTDFFSGAHFHFSVVQVALLAMYVVKHP